MVELLELPSDIILKINEAQFAGGDSLDPLSRSCKQLCSLARPFIWRRFLVEINSTEDAAKQIQRLRDVGRLVLTGGLIREVVVILQLKELVDRRTLRYRSHAASRMEIQEAQVEEFILSLCDLLANCRHSLSRFEWWSQDPDFLIRPHTARQKGGPLKNAIARLTNLKHLTLRHGFGFSIYSPPLSSWFPASHLVSAKLCTSDIISTLSLLAKVPTMSDVALYEVAYKPFRSITSDWLESDNFLPHIDPVFWGQLRRLSLDLCTRIGCASFVDHLIRSNTPALVLEELEVCFRDDLLDDDTLIPAILRAWTTAGLKRLLIPERSLVKRSTELSASFPSIDVLAIKISPTPLSVGPTWWEHCDANLVVSPTQILAAALVSQPLVLTTTVKVNWSAHITKFDCLQTLGLPLGALERIYMHDDLARDLFCTWEAFPTRLNTRKRLRPIDESALRGLAERCPTLSCIRDEWLYDDVRRHYETRWDVIRGVDREGNCTVRLKPSVELAYFRRTGRIRRVIYD